MIRLVTLACAVVFFLAAIATVVFSTLGFVVHWEWFILGVVTLAIAVVAGSMALTGTWIWALVEMDS